MRKITIKQDEEKPVPIEIMAQAIRNISLGVSKLRNGPLNNKALLLLIQHATPTYGRPGRIPISQIECVLDGIEALEATYLKKEKK